MRGNAEYLFKSKRCLRSYDSNPFYDLIYRLGMFTDTLGKFDLGYIPFVQYLIQSLTGRNKKKRLV